MSQSNQSTDVNDPSLIEVINKLQAISKSVKNVKLDLPQIVVVGSQSSGKSSVLENIVGRDFLPRGSGIVTRRPLTLQLITLLDENAQEYGVFHHKPGKKYTDFNMIREEIVAETNRTIKGAGVSSDEIVLQLFGPKFLNLSLVDLPGLTQLAIKDQPRDIVAQIKQMVLKYISDDGHKNSIILAVTAANTDLATSESLKIARQVDPEGNRTLGVLTKVDLMEPGTDLRPILAGQVIPLKLGFVPVINRGQADIESGKPITAALEYESNFFANHAAYSAKRAFCGTPFLARKLQALLMSHIQQHLPGMKASVATQIQNVRAQLDRLGEEVGGASASTTVLKLITEFNAEYRAWLDGTNRDLSSTELSGGARLAFVFHELFSNAIKSINPFDGVTDEDIRTSLYNSSGVTLPIFVSHGAFQSMVKNQINRLQEPSSRCIKIIHDELIRILKSLVSRPSFQRFPRLVEEFEAVVLNFFATAIEPTRRLVDDLVRLESCYINTGHPDFIGASRAMAETYDAHRDSSNAPIDPKTGKPIPSKSNGRSSSPSVDLESSSGSGFFGSFFSSKNKKPTVIMESPSPALKASQSLSVREKQEVEVTKRLILSYFNIVRRTIIDTVPKAIMLHLVEYTKENLQAELLESIYKSDKIGDFVQESTHTIQLRRKYKESYSDLLRIQAILDEGKSYSGPSSKLDAPLSSSSGLRNEVAMIGDNFGGLKIKAKEAEKERRGEEGENLFAGRLRGR